MALSESESPDLRPVRKWPRIEVKLSGQRTERNDGVESQLNDRV